MKNMRIKWIGFGGAWFASGWRLNGGGYVYPANPYKFWIVGPIKIMRWM